MFETLDKLFLAGLGAVSMTKERAEALFEEYVQKGKAKREEKSGFIKEVLDMAEKSRADLEKIISEQLQKVMSQMPLATKEDLKRLEEKIDQLLKK
jgi:polyhydroxyalkanoate synthesis regulator phasin